jgi:hypothetical protein
MAVAQFIFHIEPLFQSSTVGNTEPGRHPFLLVTGENDFSSVSLHLVTECMESRGELIQISIHSDQDPSEVLTEEGRTGRDTYQLTLFLRLDTMTTHHIRHLRVPIAWQLVHPLDAGQARIG